MANISNNNSEQKVSTKIHSKKPPFSIEKEFLLLNETLNELSLVQKQMHYYSKEIKIWSSPQKNIGSGF